MIVKDPVNTHKIAEKISRKLIKLFLKKSAEINAEIDPAEIIYLSAHVCANFVTKLALAMDGYNKIYGFDKFNGAVFMTWVHEIEKELIAMNKNVLTDVVDKLKEEKV